jgi:hypothetical protein
MNLFNPGPILESDIEVVFGEWWFVLAMCVVSLLLSRATYTDIFKGRIIENKINLALFVIGLILTPLIYSNIFNHLLIVFFITLFLIFLVIIGATAEGDLKMYFGLSFILGLASIYMLFISWFVIIIYSIPIAIKTVRENKKSKEPAKFGHRLGSAPGGPGIAISFIIVIGLLTSGWLFALMTGLYAVGFGGFYLRDHLRSRSAQPSN